MRGCTSTAWPRIAALARPRRRPRCCSETARHLALWMSYEDTIRVAELKTRAHAASSGCAARCGRAPTSCSRSTSTCTRGWRRSATPCRPAWAAGCWRSGWPRRLVERFARKGRVVHDQFAARLPAAVPGGRPAALAPRHAALRGRDAAHRGVAGAHRASRRRRSRARARDRALPAPGQGLRRHPRARLAQLRDADGRACSARGAALRRRPCASCAKPRWPTSTATGCGRRWRGTRWPEENGKLSQQSPHMKASTQEAVAQAFEPSGGAVQRAALGRPRDEEGDPGDTTAQLLRRRRGHGAGDGALPALLHAGGALVHRPGAARAARRRRASPRTQIDGLTRQQLLARRPTPRSA